MTRAQTAVWVAILAVTIIALPFLSYATVLDMAA